MTAIANTNLDLQLYDVDFSDDLEPQRTTVTACSHDDAADQIADLHHARIEATIRRADADHVDYTDSAALRFAQPLDRPGGHVVDPGDTWLIQPSA